MAARSFFVGDSTASDHEFVFDIGLGSANPRLRYSNSGAAIQISLDGSTFTAIASSSGVTPSKTVNNNTGGTLAAGTLVYLSAYNSGQSLYQISKAVVTTDSTTSLFAKWIVDAAITTGTSGTVVANKVLTGLDTSGLTVGRPVFLSTTAGEWVGAYYTDESRCQIVGEVIEVHASTGRIELNMPGQIVPWGFVDQV